MTAPGGGPMGEARVEVRASTRRFPGDVKDGLEKAGKDADKLAGTIGEGVGDKIADGTSKELGKHGRDFADAIESGIGRETIHIDGARYTVDRHGRLHNAAGEFVANFTEEVNSAFDRLGGGAGGGPFGRIGEAISDAIGAAFNVSGKSPLIGALVPVMGSVLGLILAAVQAASALVAVLTTLPALLAGIGLQVGVLMIAFDGIGDAVKGAFAATNAKELQEALKGLTPPAQDFVRSLLPLEPLFKEIQRVTQTNFFQELGDVVPRIQKALGPQFLSGFATLATTMGKFFRDLGLFFASPTFVSFVRDVFPATGRWVSRFGPAFLAILDALIHMATVAMPFLENLGLLLSNNLASWARRLNDITDGDGFTGWLEDMLDTLEKLFGVFNTFMGLVAALSGSLNQAGGATLLDTLIDIFNELAFFFSSPMGVKAMEGFVNFAKMSLFALAGLIIIVASLAAGLQFLGEALHEFWRWLTQVAGPSIGDFFVWLFNKTKDIGGSIKNFFDGLVNNIQSFFIRMGNTIQARVNSAIGFIQSLPGRAKAALGNLGGFLYDAGRSLIQGFINGIRNMFGPLEDIARKAMNIVGQFVPGSPAEKGPFSGHGYTKLRGQRMVDDFGAGMREGFGDLRQGIGSDMGALVSALQPQINPSAGVTLGNGAVRVTFTGALPTEEQAHAAGAAAGAGLVSQLTQRNVTLGVRRM